MVTASAATAPKIPRAQWASHPRFSTQALLLGSHANFRRVSRYLVGKASEEKFVGLHSLFDRWIWAMRSHEAYEERKLYPFLERRWGISLAEAREGHEVLHARPEEVTGAFHSLADPTDATTDNRVLAALRAHDVALDAHLQLEEDAVIPLLLELSPEEFDAYYIGGT